MAKDLLGLWSYKWTERAVIKHFLSKKVKLVLVLGQIESLMLLTSSPSLPCIKANCKGCDPWYNPMIVVLKL